MKKIATARYPGEIWDIGRGRKMGAVHLRADCSSETPCMFHYPTEHPMTEFPYHWRDDRMIMERLCPHGIGHPDPDQYQYWVNQEGRREADAQMVHGCDGCCVESGPVPFLATVPDESEQWMDDSAANEAIAPGADSIVPDAVSFPHVTVTQHDHVSGIYSETCSACIDAMEQMGSGISEEGPVTREELQAAILDLRQMIRSCHPSVDFGPPPSL